MGMDKKGGSIGTKLATLVLVTMLTTMEVAPTIGYAIDRIDEPDKESIMNQGEEQPPKEEGNLSELEDIPTGDNQEDTIIDEETTTTKEVNTEEVAPINPEITKDNDTETEITKQTNTKLKAVTGDGKYVLATDKDFSGTTNGTFKYIGTDEYVEIPHKIKGVNVTSYANMFEGGKAKGVKSTNKNITNMTYMFYNYMSVTLDVSQLDTTNVGNMGYMFGAKTSSQTDTVLTGIYFGNFYTGKVTGMVGMFWNSRVVDLDVSSFDTRMVTSMNSMFDGANARDLDLRNFNTSNVAWMEKMFYNSGATSINVTGFDTTKVVGMAGMFGAEGKGINALRTLDISNFNTISVTNMSSMFSRTLVKDLDLSNFNTSNVTNMGNMFYDSDIVDLDLSSFDTRNVVSMNGMFYGIKATNIDLRSFRTNKVTNMGNMFMLAKVKRLDLSSFDTSSVLTMSGMFMGSEVEELDLTSFNTSRVSSMLDMFRESKATIINISSFGTANVGNMGFMFYKSKAKELKLRNFNTTKVKNMSYMFTGTDATSLDVSSFDTRNVTSMDNMFEDSKASALDLTNFNTQRITTMSNMFKGAQASTIKVGNFDTKYVTDMSGMFQDTKATSLDLSSFDMGSVNDVSRMFTGALAKTGKGKTREDANKLNTLEGKPTGLTFTPKYVLATDEDFSGTLNGYFRYTGKDDYIDIPTTIKGTKVNNYTGMFENTSVKGVVSHNKNITTMSNMFKGNTSTELDVSGLTTSGVTNMSGMFQDTKVTILDMSKFDTEKVTAMDNMFKNTKVKELDLGSFNTKSLATTEDMFIGATALTGYGRTKEDVDKLNKSRNKPSGLTFTVWGITTEQNITNWTNQNIDIKVNAGSSTKGISYVEMVNESGRNLLSGTDKGNTNETYKGLGVTTHSHPGGSGYQNTFHQSSINPLLKGKYTISFYAKSSQENKEFYTFFYSPNTTLTGVNSQGYVRSSPDGNSYFKASNKWEKYWVTYTQTPSSQPKYVLIGRIFNGGDLSIAGVKLEEGDIATPWSPAPEDSASTGDQKDLFTVYNNGTYIFRATDKGGNTKTVSHTVTNIDTVNPTADIKKSTTGWTSQDVTLYVSAKDELSGVKSIILPDGSIINSDTAEYKASANGKYTFTVEDNAGNRSIYTEEVTNIDRNVPRLTTELSNKSWTKDPINIKVTSEDSASGLKDIEMISSPEEGKNLLHHTGITSKLKEHNYYYDEILEKDGKYAYAFVGGKNGANNISFLGQDDYELVDGKEYTFSFYAKASNPIKLKDDSGVYLNSKNSRYLNGQEISTEWERYSFNFVAKVGGKVGVHIYPIYKDSGETFYVTGWKLEEGNKLTPWTPSPDESLLENNTKTYNVASNGLYTFKSTYNNGLASEISANVTNIDREDPKLTITGNPEDWVEDDEVTLTINASDTQSGVNKIILPNGAEYNGTKTTYKVNANGEYTFKVVDNVGNQTTVTETVKYLMIPYNFYIYDKENKPVEGAVFELLRNGEAYKKATSTDKGYVNFGKIPPDGKYSVRQVTAPDGVVVNPGDIEAPDVTEPIEFIKYPRGTIFPSTGTLGWAIIGGLTVTLVSGVAYVINKKRKIGKH